jgi:carboxymethylenebutenolidase
MDVRATWVELPGDGAVASVYVAEPDGPGPYPGLLYFPTRLGVNEQHLKMARDFASHGYVVALPDLYYRLGHRVVFDPAADPAERAAAEESLSDFGLAADTRAILDHLKRHPRVNPHALGCVGYCAGGRIAFLAACCLRDIRATVDAYGGGVVARTSTPRRPIEPLALAEGLSGPVLHLSGSRDPLVPPADVQIIAAHLARHGKHFEYEIFEGAGHGYFDADIPRMYHPEAARIGWERKLAFLKQHLQNGTASRPG